MLNFKARKKKVGNQPSLFVFISIFYLLNYCFQAAVNLL